MSTQNQNVVNWAEGVQKLPKWVQVLLSLIGQIIKAPNFIWNLPGLSKFKGIRLLVLSVLAALNEALTAIDINVVANASCKIAEMANKICDPSQISWWYHIITGWLIAALAVEDKSDKKGGNVFEKLAGLFRKK